MKLHAPANDAAGFRALISACNISAVSFAIEMIPRTQFIAKMGTEHICKRCEGAVRRAIAEHNPNEVQERYSIGYYLESR